jgi:hypothetical protein
MHSIFRQRVAQYQAFHPSLRNCSHYVFGSGADIICDDKLTKQKELDRVGSSIAPLLTSRRISFPVFCADIKLCKWSRVFGTIANVLLYWHFALASIPSFRVSQYDPDVFRSLVKIAQCLPDFDNCQ